MSTARRSRAQPAGGAEGDRCPRWPTTPASGRASSGSRELAAAIDHPNVIPIYEAGERRRPAVHGHAVRPRAATSARCVDQERPLEPDRAATDRRRRWPPRSTPPTAPGSSTATSSRPTSCSTADDDEHAYLTDFGLTKRGGRGRSALTKTGQCSGTLDYMAPEQIRGEAGGCPRRRLRARLPAPPRRSRAGAVPTESEIARIYAHLEDDPPQASRQAGGIPPAVDEVVATAMAKEPEDRYGPPASSAGPRARRSRRHRGAVAPPPRRRCRRGRARRPPRGRPGRRPRPASGRPGHPRRPTHPLTQADGPATRPKPAHRDRVPGHGRGRPAHDADPPSAPTHEVPQPPVARGHAQGRRRAAAAAWPPGPAGGRPW